MYISVLLRRTVLSAQRSPGVDHGHIESGRRRRVGDVLQRMLLWECFAALREGEIRYTSGTTPTNLQYTGQINASEVGLYFYNARWDASPRSTRSFRNRAVRWPQLPKDSRERIGLGMFCLLALISQGMLLHYMV